MEFKFVPEYVDIDDEKQSILYKEEFPVITEEVASNAEEIGKIIKMINTKLNKLKRNNIIFNAAVLDLTTMKIILDFCLSFPINFETMLSIIENILVCSQNDIKQLACLGILNYFASALENPMFYPFYERIILISSDLTDLCSNEEINQISRIIFKFLIDPLSIESAVPSLLSEEMNLKNRQKIQLSCFSFFSKLKTFGSLDFLPFNESIPICNEMLPNTTDIETQKVFITFLSKIIEHFPILIEPQPFLEFISKYIIEIENTSKAAKKLLQDLSILSHFIIRNFDSNLVLSFGFFDILFKFYYAGIDVIDDMIYLFSKGELDPFMIERLCYERSDKFKFLILHAIVLIKTPEDYYANAVESLKDIIPEMFQIIESGTEYEVSLVIDGLYSFFSYLSKNGIMNEFIQENDIDTMIEILNSVTENLNEEESQKIIEINRILSEQ